MAQRDPRELTERIKNAQPPESPRRQRTAESMRSAGRSAEGTRGVRRPDSERPFGQQRPAGQQRPSEQQRPSGQQRPSAQPDRYGQQRPAGRPYDTDERRPAQGAPGPAGRPYDTDGRRPAQGAPGPAGRPYSGRMPENGSQTRRPAPETYSGRPTSGTYSGRPASGSPSGRPPVRRRKKKSHGGLVAVIIAVLLAAVIAAVVLIPKNSGTESENVTASGETTTAGTGKTGKSEEKPLLPEPAVMTSATIGSTGDILLHSPILNAFNTGDGYDFSAAFSYVAPYYEKADLMVANLEVTLAGEDYGYSSYPVFNSPDSIVDALKDAGVDVCLTANNHTYDTGGYGMARTLEVLDESGLGHLGTRESTDEPYIMARIVNGIKVGMICYTYDTREQTNGHKSLNGNWVSDDDVDLVNTFCYSDLESFYDDVEQQIYYMNMLGCEAKIFYIHWGEEYQDDPNGYQTEISQRLCDMGVDVIIGGHPHVVQKFDTFESDDGHQMICLYSMGNELSNQRKELMNEDGYRGYTEDGVVFYVTIEKFNNGKVKVGAVEVLPTWVQKGDSYRIVPLDSSISTSEWQTFDLDSAIDSYNRTLGRVGDAYTAYRAKKKQDEVPEYLE